MLTLFRNLLLTMAVIIGCVMLAFPRVKILVTLEVRLHLHLPAQVDARAESTQLHSPLLELAQGNHQIVVIPQHLVSHLEAHDVQIPKIIRRNQVVAETITQKSTITVTLTVADPCRQPKKMEIGIYSRRRVQGLIQNIFQQMLPLKRI